MVEELTSMHKTLGSKCSTIKNKKEFTSVCTGTYVSLAVRNTVEANSWPKGTADWC